MDDYNVSNLSEAKNEYSARLVNILTPLILEGVKSLFTDAKKLCMENNESSKYLMTFQNFLSRIPKWNPNIISTETERIVTKSQCPYLEDLITCVHIAQLKILTSIRVGQKQKKIDIDVPKLDNFIHKVYVAVARKLYSNVYLFEDNVLPLNYQKNMRECELIIRESILNVVRDSVPVESILRSYIEETVEEEVEVKEEIIEKEREIDVSQNAMEEMTQTEETTTLQEGGDKTNAIIVKKDTTSDDVAVSTTTESFSTEEEETLPNELAIVKLDNDTTTETGMETGGEKKVLTLSTPIDDVAVSQDENITLSFNDKDSVLNIDTNTEEQVSAPKTIERLEEISEIRNLERKLEEEEEEEEELEKLTIHGGAPISLEAMDIHDLNKPFTLDTEPLLTDIEILS
jgi:hypothetical protein